MVFRSAPLYLALWSAPPAPVEAGQSPPWGAPEHHIAVALLPNGEGAGASEGACSVPGEALGGQQ